MAIIGEASTTLLKKYPEFCKRHPEIVLQQARRMRNILVHDYSRILWPMVWETVQTQLPVLIHSISPYVSANQQSNIMQRMAADQAQYKKCFAQEMLDAETDAAAGNEAEQLAERSQEAGWQEEEEPVIVSTNCNDMGFSR